MFRVEYEINSRISNNKNHMPNKNNVKNKLLHILRFLGLADVAAAVTTFLPVLGI